MTRITVIGGGYVGLVTSACFAELGHNVRCLEADAGKVSMLRSGVMPIQEPGLTELWSANSAAGRLCVTDNPEEALFDTDFIYIAVGTPESADGSADLSYVESAVATAVKLSDRSTVICVKSTVPPGTCASLQAKIRASLDPAREWTVVSNPEFLSQGRAVKDFMTPDRVVVGSSDDRVSWKVAELYSSLDAPVVTVDSTASEMVKYASNSFLALKISFINEVSRLCESSGTDVGQVALGMGLDNRIGSRFLEAGMGWGGSCFPKDTAALESLMKSAGVESRIVSATRAVNVSQVEHIVKKLSELAPPAPRASVAVLGLTFKDGTDDLRGSQAIPLIEKLLAAGYEVRAYDPVSPALRPELAERITMCESAVEALFGASAMVLATAWPEFVAMDYAAAGPLMAEKVVIDARRALDPAVLRSNGFAYYRPGDGRVAPQTVTSESIVDAPVEQAVAA